MRRFFVEKVSNPAFLSEAESRHAARVLRLAPGEHVTVFDRTEAWLGKIEAIEDRVRVRLLEPLPAPGRSVAIVASAIPKGSRLDWMIEKLAELGTAEFIPVRFARSVADLGHAKRRRLERLAVAAAKQSGAPVMTIGPERTVEELPAGAGLLSPGATDPLPPGGGMVVVGPEGGMTPGEESRFSRRFSLGTTILRIETAAVVAAARIMS